MTDKVALITAGGSGMGAAGDGGGLVRVRAEETVTVNGTISANGGTGDLYGGAGSGGAVFITCASFAATGGVIEVEGESHPSPRCEQVVRNWISPSWYASRMAPTFFRCP